MALLQMFDFLLLYGGSGCERRFQFRDFRGELGSRAGALLGDELVC